MISWTTYLTAISIFLVGYYFLVGLVYFRKELFRKLQPAPARTAFASVEPKAELVNNPDSDLQVQSPAMLDEIHAYMDQAAKEPELEQEAMMASIRKILNKYPSITDSFIKLSINDLVIALAESKCGIEVRPEVLRELWN